MTTEALIQDIGKIIVFLLVLLAIFLFTVKAKKKLANQLFAVFLLLTAFDMSGFFIGEGYNQYPAINMLKIASVLLQMPMFYLYVKSACYYNFKLETKHLLHAILFIACLILFAFTNLSSQSYELFNTVTRVQYYAYILAVLFTLRQFKKLHRENYSYSDQSIYQWLLQTTLLFLIGNSFGVLKELSSYFQNHAFLSYINLIISLFALCVICWFVLKAMYQPKLFTGIDKNLSVSKAILPEDQTYEKELRHLAAYMAHEKPYFDAELTLQKLASHLEIPEKQVSFLINHKLGKHFFDYINEFRIQEAQVLLTDNMDLTVLEILYQVGFNSKSSFYTAFKKLTNQTPTAYRKSRT